MKQQQITYDKGITYVPSDALCSDNALSECVGMTCENGEMKPIQKPEVFINSAVDGSSAMDEIPVLLYIHKFNNEERYIGYIESSGEYPIVWGEKDGTQFVKQGGLLNKDNQPLYYTDKTRITSVGKTLIVADDNGMEYNLWSNDTYEPLGTSFPRPEVEYKLGDRNDIREYKNITGSGIYFQNSYYHIDETHQSDWNNTVIGLYSSLRKNIWQKKAFVGSFCVRAALELYDGSYYHVQNPVFMLNHFSPYCIAYLDGTQSDAISVKMEAFGENLYYKFSQDYTKWSDIVKNVVLFVTREVSLFDTASDAILKLGSESEHSNESVCHFMSANKIYADPTEVGGTHRTIQGLSHIVLNSNPDSDIEETIRDGTYYKLCEIGVSGDGQYHSAGDNFDTHKIENITTQSQLVTDDWYSHCDIKAGMLYSYNSRLNLAQVQRGIFEGFDFFMPFTLSKSESTEEQASYEFIVSIETDGKTITVSKSVTTVNKQGIYFYYPDPRAKKLVIKKDGEQILNTNLKEHPTLNGSYYFGSISPGMDEPSVILDPPPAPSVSEDRFEVLPNYILTSEVNNPFVFRPEGYFKVGTGKIIGCSTVTQALSEGQFGQFPLLVFSESGIWALTVGSTGYYTSIHPISREVCSNANSITQTDGAIYFVSEKGLMIIVGSTVKCVSEQMDGKMFDGAAPFSFVLDGDFESFLKDCRIAYDYRDSQLVIINESYTFQWVYNMKSSTFSKAQMVESVIDNVVNDYPDNLLQLKDDENGERLVYSLFTKPEQNHDGVSATNNGVTTFTPTYYSGTLLTRPMKLENGLALKTIMDLKNIKMFNQDTYTTTEGQTTTTHDCLVLTMYGSNDCKNWKEVPSLTGVPWKYYRFKFEFSHLIATDRFAGTVLVTQERRTNKLR